MTVQPPELAAAEQLDAAVSAAARTASQADAADHMRGLFGRDSIYLLVWAVQVGIAALSIPINTRLLGGNEFGVVTTALAVMQVLVAIGVFSLPTSVQRAYRAEDGGRDARRVITLSMGTAAITLVIAFSSGRAWSQPLTRSSFPGAMSYAVIWASLTAVTYSALALLRSRDNLAGYAAVSFVQS